MGNLLRYSTPAERLRGLSFSEIGGTFTGSNNILYTLEGNEFYSDEISMVIEFWPSFNWDEDLTRKLFQADGASLRFLGKFNSAANKALVVRWEPTTNILVITTGAYSSYWKVNQRNLVVITAKSTDNKFYYDGDLIATSTTAWTKIKSNDLFLGSNNVGTENFIGKIPNVKISNRILNQQEVTDIWNNSTYNYINNPLIHYPMTAATHSGSQTLDISGNGLHGTLIGSPTKLSGKGYSFNGSTQYVTFPEQTFTGEFSIAMFNKPNDTTLDGLIGHVSDSNKILLNSGNIFVRVVTNSDTTILAPGTVVNFTGLTRDADNKVDLYVNGKKYRLFNDVAQSGSSLWDFIGRTESGTQNLDGNIYDVFIDNKCLTPTQMHDMYVRGINVR